MNCVVMHLESFSEIGASVFRGDLAVGDIRVARSIIDGKDVVHGHLPSMMRIELVECLLNELIPVLVQCATSILKNSPY